MKIVVACFRFVEFAADVNRRMPDYVVQWLGGALAKRGMSASGPGCPSA
ncbi:hypothetical protein [Streptomyces sp. NPDC058486]